MEAVHDGMFYRVRNLFVRPFVAERLEDIFVPFRLVSSKWRESPFVAENVFDYFTKSVDDLFDELCSW
jgi:hypothetical protein